MLQPGGFGRLKPPHSKEAPGTYIRMGPEIGIRMGPKARDSNGTGSRDSNETGNRASDGTGSGEAEDQKPNWRPKVKLRGRA